MDHRHTMEEKLQILERFSHKLVDSSYKEATRKEILILGISRYYRLVLLDLMGRRSLHRSAEDIKGGREVKPLKTRVWYKTQGEAQRCH